MQSSVAVAGMDALSESPRKHFDTSGKSAALFHHRAICKTPWPCPTTGRLLRPGLAAALPHLRAVDAPLKRAFDKINTQVPAWIDQAQFAASNLTHIVHV